MSNLSHLGAAPFDREDDDNEEVDADRLNVNDLKKNMNDLSRNFEVKRRSAATMFLNETGDREHFQNHSNRSSAF